jgi:hypothetical protein
MEKTDQKRFPIFALNHKKNIRGMIQQIFLDLCLAVSPPDFGLQNTQLIYSPDKKICLKKCSAGT